MRSLVRAALVVSLSLASSACGGAGVKPKSGGAAPTVLPQTLLSAPLTDTAGRPVVLADVLASGKTLTLVFWQSWCAPCRREAPELVAASRKYPGMEVLGVVSGPDDAVDAAALERAIVEWGLPWRSVRDRALDLTRALAVEGTPTIFVLDTKGHVVYRGHEAPEWEAVLRKAAR